MIYRLKDIDRDVETIGREISNLGIGMLQISCLGRLYKQETDDDKGGVETIKEVVREDKVDFFEKRIGF